MSLVMMNDFCRQSKRIYVHRSSKILYTESYIQYPNVEWLTIYLADNFLLSY